MSLPNTTTTSYTTTTSPFNDLGLSGITVRESSLISPGWSNINTDSTGFVPNGSIAPISYPNGTTYIPYTATEPGIEMYIYPNSDKIISDNSLDDSKSKNKEKVKMSPTTIIKNRAHIFRSFLSVLDKNRDKFISESGFTFPESDMESKKRCKYWSGHLFEPTPVFLKKILYITTLKNGENDMKWQDINSVETLTPIGIDIWGTVGGFAQKEEIDWGKALFYFVPSPALKKMIKENVYPVCFTTSYAIEIPKPKALDSKETTNTRMIDYDLQ